MKAIVVRQPWATLIAMGIKTIETRPSPPNGPMRPEGVRGLPGCTLERGERIAIVAGAAAPMKWQRLAGLRVEPTLDGDFGLTNYSLPGTDQMTWHPLQLGAVVGTVTVDDALPIIHCEPYDHPLTRRDRNRGERAAWASKWSVFRNGAHYIGAGGLDGGPWLVSGVGDWGSASALYDQLPLGDFEPGRWGWLMSNVQPIDPIPCKGRQGVFTLPDDVAAQLAEPEETE